MNDKTSIYACVLRYSEAMATGDAETITKLWDLARMDPALARALRDWTFEQSRSHRLQQFSKSS